MVDHFGFTHIVNDNDLSAPTHRLANETTSFSLRHPRGCNASTCLRAGFLPFDRVPRVGSWLEHRSTAVVHHIVEDGSPSAAGSKPFRGHRQRVVLQLSLVIPLLKLI